MKKKLFTIAAFVAATSFFVGCKPKDEDIAKAVTEKLASMGDLKGGSVSVVEGVATITGECKDDACSQKCKAALESAGIKGVKSIDWKGSITPPPPAPVAPVVATVQPAAPASITTTLDAKVMQTIKDGLKDIKGVAVDFATAKPMISGEVSAADRMKIMQMFASAKIVPDVTKLITKK